MSESATTPDNTASFEDIVRAVKFTEAQCAMSDYHRREQWMMVQEQQNLINETRKSFREICKDFRLAAFVIFLLVLAQMLLLVFSAAILRQRIDRIERALPSLQQVQQVQLPATNESFCGLPQYHVELRQHPHSHVVARHPWQIFPGVQNDVVLPLGLMLFRYVQFDFARGSGKLNFFRASSSSLFVILFG